MDLEIKSLDDLKSACKRLGLEFCEGKTDYAWFGRSVGDYELPTGFTADELGKCEHAIRLPDGHPSKVEGGWHGEEGHRWFDGTYEIGVVKRRDGKPGWTLLWDFYNGGYGLESSVGENCSALKQAYGVCAAKRAAIQQGFRVQELKKQDGSVQLRLTK